MEDGMSRPCPWTEHPILGTYHISTKLVIHSGPAATTRATPHLLASRRARVSRVTEETGSKLHNYKRAEQNSVNKTRLQTRFYIEEIYSLGY